MYALVDCNNFYASCERAFDPRLNKKPIVVLSNNDGCVIARSEEAKQLGIQMGAPVHLIDALLKKNNVSVFSANYTLYGDMSNRVMEMLAAFVPCMEIYSIDEAFLDMRQMKHANLQQLAKEMKQRIRQNSGIPVCIGIAATKTLAKMANRFAKKNPAGLAVYPSSDKTGIEQMLQSSAVQDIWGIGKQYAMMLQKKGILTARDLVGTPDDWIRKHMSVVGLRTVHELRGIASISFEPGNPAKKNIGTSRAFGKLVSDKCQLKQAISNYAANCALKLRQQHSAAKEVRIFLHTNTFRQQDAQYYRSIVLQLPVATNSSADIIKSVLKGLDIIYKPGYLYHKCGVELQALVPDNEIQLPLFEKPEVGKQRKAMAMMDELNAALGKDTLRFGIQGFEKNYRARAAFLSPKYTTDIRQVIHIRH